MPGLQYNACLTRQLHVHVKAGCVNPVKGDCSSPMSGQLVQIPEHDTITHACLYA